VGYKIHSATREGERNAKDGGKDSPRAKLGHRPREDQSDYSRRGDSRKTEINNSGSNSWMDRFDENAIESL
jgi:hypothetical protein